MRLTPRNELEHRFRKLQQYMADESLDAVMILQNADLFYFTGTVQAGTLYVPAHGEPIYMVRKDFSRARMECGLKEVVPFASMAEIPSILAAYGYPVPHMIGMELDVLPVNFYERYRQVFPNGRLVDATPAIRRVRMIKSHYEIHILQDAAQQVDKVYRHAAGVIREGITDIELAAELECVARKEGHQGLIRMRAFNGEMVFGHVFSGVDTAIPGYLDTPFSGLGPHPCFGQGASWNPIERDQPVIVDLAGSFDGYVVDQTRIFAIGSIPDRLRKGYEDMLKVQERMEELAVPGVPWGQLYEECCGLAVAMGHGDSFMGAGGARVSFIGHGLGLEIDEYPFIARGFNEMTLEAGMVFAFEPKVVFPGEGAVGIENTFYMTESGLKRLTFSPEELVVL